MRSGAEPTQPGRPLVVVVGPPGAGKTTVGTLLAQRWGVGFRDTDADVERVAGESVADLFVRHGEEHFRDLERRAVAAAVAAHDGVLAIGGGAVLDAGTRELLRGQRVVFLDVGVSDAARRIGLNRDRPLLLGNPRRQWAALMEARRPLYEQVAQVTVATDGLSAAEVVDRVVAALGTR